MPHTIAKPTQGARGQNKAAKNEQCVAKRASAIVYFFCLAEAKIHPPPADAPRGPILPADPSRGGKRQTRKHFFEVAPFDFFVGLSLAAFTT